jgi:hypothetical protein
MSSWQACIDASESADMRIERTWMRALRCQDTTRGMPKLAVASIEASMRSSRLAAPNVQAKSAAQARRHGGDGSGPLTQITAGVVISQLKRFRDPVDAPEGAAARPGCHR